MRQLNGEFPQPGRRRSRLALAALVAATSFLQCSNPTEATAPVPSYEYTISRSYSTALRIKSHYLEGLDAGMRELVDRGCGLTDNKIVLRTDGGTFGMRAAEILVHTEAPCAPEITTASPVTYKP